MNAPTGSAVGLAPPVQHAHSTMHCNLNTVDGPRAVAFYMAAFGVEPRMRSVEDSGDATAMGLGSDTASITTFLYDRRGPRAAPALELVDWSRPATSRPRPGQAPSGFTAIGYRVPSLGRLGARLTALGHPATGESKGLNVRGRTLPGLHTTDPDGVRVEVVEVPPVADDPQADGILSYARMACTDLDRTLGWYGSIGWTERARGQDGGGAWASIVLPEDPTFSLEFTEDPGRGDGASRPANTQGLYRMALAVDDVRAAAAALAADGRCGEVPETVTIPMPDTPTGGFTVLFLADPDGAVVELAERPRSQVRRPSAPA
jgi:catechol 2,3-dioxygenase-like lactoylglutathione lyase family enzyme